MSKADIFLRAFEFRPVAHAWASPPASPAPHQSARPKPLSIDSGVIILAQGDSINAESGGAWLINVTHPGLNMKRTMKSP